MIVDEFGPLTRGSRARFDELMEDWNLCSRLQSPNPIEPLR